MNNDRLWKHILDSKYESWRELNNGIENKKESWWWRDLKRATNEEGKRILFHESVACTIGNGKKIKFWHDVWMVDEPFLQNYPRLYINSLNKDAKVGDLES